MAEVKVYRCRHCGIEIRGNIITRHERSCERRPRGETRKLYPIELAIEIHRRFHARCKEHDQTIGDRVRMLIERDLEG